MIFATVLPSLKKFCPRDCFGRNFPDGSVGVASADVPDNDDDEEEADDASPPSLSIVMVGATYVGSSSSHSHSPSLPSTHPCKDDLEM